MPASVIRVIRRRPVRCAVYALLAVGVIWGTLTVRGILRGERNALLTGVAQSQLLRGWVERELHVRYSIGSVALLPKCGFEIDVRAVNVELVGAASGGIDAATVCLYGSAQVQGIRIGPQLIGVNSVQVDWPKSIQGEGVVWRDSGGDLVTARSFTASPGAFSGGVTGLQVLNIAGVKSATASVRPSLAPAIEVKSAEARGIRVNVTQAAIAQAESRFQAAANALEAMGTASMPFLAQWNAAAQRLLREFILAAAALLLVVKLLVTRAPFTPAWRLAAIVAPFAAFPLLAMTHSWVAIAVAALAVPAFLWGVAYRRASERPQRLEPAAVDALTVLLALPLLLLLNWPAVAAPRIPAIDQVSVAQADVSDAIADVQEALCGSATSTQVSVPKAKLTNLRVTLDGSKLKTLDLQRLTVSGEVRTQSLAALQKIRYLPAQWKVTPPFGFCAGVAIQNAGAVSLPETDCPARMTSPSAIVRASVDFAGQAARFAVNWTGAPAPLVASGTADLEGARIDDIHTTSGAAVKIGKGAVQAAWSRILTARAQLQGVEVSGVAVDRVAFDASAPMLCEAGPVNVAAQAGKTSYAFGGNQIALDGVALNFTRPDAGGFSGSARTGLLSLSGPVETSVPSAELVFTGVTSREPIPQKLTLATTFTTPSVSVAAPVRLAVDLWSGDWQLVDQSIAIEQHISTRLPQSVALELGASGSLTSLATPFQAGARALVRIPSLVPDVGPVDLTLNDLSASIAWDAVAGLAPVKISTGWNAFKPGETPTGFQLNEVSTLHLATRGTFVETPTLDSLPIAIPSVPSEFKFRLEGTPQSISILSDIGPPVILDQIETSNLKVSLPGLRLQSAEMETSLRVKRTGAEFPVAARTRLTDTTTDVTILAPLSAEVSTTPQAVHFALTKPLDTGKLLKDVGLTIDGVDLRTTVNALQVSAGFAGTKLTAIDVAGAVAPGPLASGRGFDVSQDAPSTFHIAGLALPKATAIFSAPSVLASFDGGKDRAWFAANGSAAFSLTSTPPSPFAARLTEAAQQLLEHAQKANLVFGGDSAAAYPVQWDIEVNGGRPVVALDWAGPETGASAALHTETVIHSLVAGKQSLFGSAKLSAEIHVTDDHLIVDLDSSGDLGAFGQRWQWGVPMRLALRSQLRTGTAGQLFDGAYYDGLGGAAVADTVRLAIGYGPALQLRTGYHGSLFSATAGGEAQAAIAWAPDAASVNSFGTFDFQGLEAGAIALPNPYLEDRLDGEVHFATQGFRATGLTLPHLLVDASSVHALDHVDVSAQVHSAADGAHLPGIGQMETALTLKPAGDLLQLLTGKLALEFPPRAVEYKRMALDFQVLQGRVQTEPTLLTLSGVRMPGVQGLTVDSDVRVHWGGNGVEPAPRLRDLIYAFQRVMEP